MLALTLSALEWVFWAVRLYRQLSHRRAIGAYSAQSGTSMPISASVSPIARRRRAHQPEDSANGANPETIECRQFAGIDDVPFGAQARIELLKVEAGCADTGTS